jgi:hypothetical protein
MGTEYYIVDDNRKIYIFLGKGTWGDGLGDSELIESINDPSKVEAFVLNTAFRGRGLEGELKLANRIYETFRDSKIEDISLYSDDWYAPPATYTQICDAYEIRGFYNGYST